MAERAEHTPGPWSVGRTLSTQQTRQWSEEEWEKNERQERRRVFAYFTATDQGRSRELVAECREEANARLIASAPGLLAALKWTHGCLHPLLDDGSPSCAHCWVRDAIDAAEPHPQE